jgi:hypothetical protein
MPANPQRKKRANAKGRDATRFGRENAVLILRRTTWHSPIVSAVSPNARVLMIELLSMYTGPGKRLFLSVKDATDRLGYSDCRPAIEAFKELEVVGLITCVAKGVYTVKAGFLRASAWRLNWMDEDGERLGPEALPSVDEKKIPKRARARLQRRQEALKRYTKEAAKTGKDYFAAVESTTFPPKSGPIQQASAVEITTLPRKNGRNALPHSVGKSTVHLSYQGDSGASEQELAILSSEVERIAGIFTPGHVNEEVLRRAAAMLGSIWRDEVVPQKLSGPIAVGKAA